MPDLGNRASDNVGQQAQEQGKELAKKAGQKVGKPIKRAAKKATQKVVNKARKGLVKAAKMGVKAAKNIGKILIQLIAKLIALIGVPMAIALAVAVVGIVVWNFIAEERGSNMGDDLDPAVQNPAIVDTETGITTALAMTEPQAVIDAYYKLMSTYSFTKSYNNKEYVFNDPNKTQDFAGLRDYYDRENNFYLSDDFIRMMDELLHGNSFYFPEQIIKPVFGQKLTLKDQDGVEGSYYTARLPNDFKSGSQSRLFNEDEVKNFSDMINDQSQLDSAIGTDELPTLIAQSQNPTPSTDAEGTTTYAMTDRNVLDGTTPSGAVPGVWDYGFGSVLQYQADQKQSYIECTYTHVQVDIDKREWIDDDDGGHWSDWSHSSIQTWPLAGITTTQQLYTQLNNYVDGLSSDTVDYTYHTPSNIAAIVDSTKAWNMSVEPNSAAEATYKSAYGRNVTNSHIDMKVDNAKDADIDRLQFSDSDLQAAFGNKGSGLYPLNIAVLSHAATFSGNIHYTIRSTSGDQCDVTTIPLSANTTADPDHRNPVTVIEVKGYCSDSSVTNRTLKATRTGNVITKTPHVEEAASPWGFAYMQDYADEYVNYVPSDYMEDRDFFLRTGLKAPEGSTAKEEYQNNLKFLLDLGLLRLYNGNVSLSAVGTVDAADMGSSSSDLYILSHLIACEAGPNKLDQLMVGSVFVNRVHSSLFPNTYWEVLTQSGQYSSYPSMYDKPGHQPSQEIIASAMQVMSGQFTIPENVLGQSANIQGSIYKVVDNGKGYNTHYYCAMPKGTAVSTVDRYGRPAPAAGQLESMANNLKGADPNNISVSGTSFDLSASCFIGDSLTVGLDTTQGLKTHGATVIAETDADLQKIKKLVDSSNIPSAVKTVYLLAGTYSCSAYDDTFRMQYQEILTAIGEKAPQAQIVLTSLPPCIDGMGHNASNAYITAKNQVINGIASAGGMQIIDIWSLLQKDGSLDPGYSADGLHLTAAGYGVWFSQVKGGATVSQIATGDPSEAFTNLDQNGIPIDSDYTLYDISNFDVLTAVNMQATIAQADSAAKSWLSKLVGGLQNVVEDALGFLTQFWNAVSEKVFPSKNEILDKCFLIGDQYYFGDIRGVVYQTITFSTQTWYSTAEDAANEMLENGDITFLFVGKDAVLGLGTVGYGTMQYVPGVTTTLDGTISPTSTYYSPLTSFDGTKVELNVPEDTNVLAIGDGKITEVGNDPSNAKGRYVIQEVVINGDTYEVTYGYLNSIVVANGETVSKGDLIGLSGSRTGGSTSLYFQVKKNGTNVDPMSIFYQSTLMYGGGSLGGNLYNSDGTVNAQAIADLEKQLNGIIGVTANHNWADVSAGFSKQAVASPYLTKPINSLQGLQCTWWAWGRGYEYLCTVKNTHITKAQYSALAHYNGGGYIYGNKLAGLFNYGTIPKPNSLACYLQPGAANMGGHVSYVEAVDYTNQCYYESECGSGRSWAGINKRNFGYAPKWHGVQYVLQGFIYLDEPKV